MLTAKVYLEEDANDKAPVVGAMNVAKMMDPGLSMR
jgi:hypothetical protein